MDNFQLEKEVKTIKMMAIVIIILVIVALCMDMYIMNHYLKLK